MITFPRRVLDGTCGRAGPAVYTDKAKSIQRAVELIADAARQDCGLIVFPEAWLPGNPTFVWRLSPGADMKKTDELFSLAQTNSVDLRKDDLAPVKEAARDYGMVVVLGYQELDGTLSGSTLFNSVAIIDADGRLLNNRRKLMPANRLADRS